jgi:hypothetical protein
MLHDQPLLSHISTHIHIYRNRTAENFQRQFNLSWENPKWRSQRRSACWLPNDGPGGKRTPRTSQR